MDEKCEAHEMVSLPGDGEDGLTAKICWRCLQRELGIGNNVRVYTHDQWLKENGETYE